MKTITEITLTEKRVYTMPDEVWSLIELSLKCRWFRSVQSAVDSLFAPVRQLVTVEVMPHELVLRGHSASIRIDDEPFTAAYDRPAPKFAIAIADEPQTEEKAITP